MTFSRHSSLSAVFFLSPAPANDIIILNGGVLRLKHSVIVYGRGEGVERAAIEQLSQILLAETGEYPSCVSCDAYADAPGNRCFFIGTRSENPYLPTGQAPTHPEEYLILVRGDTVRIEGADAAGVLYGCVDFYNRYIALRQLTHNSENYFRNLFEGTLPDAEIRSAPSVRNRGLWTWGHVICDYRGYIDNMVRLKMNTIIIWNDHVPLNAAEIVSYAHAHGVKVIWGFSWLWDTQCLKTDMSALADASDAIIDHYETHYAALQGDGIYFQSFTELHQETIGGVLIAEAVTAFVNDTARRLLERHPALELQFGLHATSVRERTEYIRKTDPRIRIVWEDCGAFPFDYLPDNTEGFDDTRALVEKIAVLRGDEERFGVVLKGLTKLDWSAFEHLRGPAFSGVAAKRTRENRMARKRDIWHYVQAGWLTNGDKALEMVRLMQRLTGGNLDVTALVEDGMFEMKLYYPVALLGEMLWDCESDLKDLTYRVALRRDVEFA